MKSNCLILLVEDEADDVYFMTRALRDSGVHLPLEVAYDGQSAVDYLDQAKIPGKNNESVRPCLMLLDLNLPRKSGLEVLKWVRQESVWKTLPIIVFTSSTSEEDMERAYALGANSYVVKPADPLKLKELGAFLKGFWFDWSEVPPQCRGLTAG